VQYQSECDLYDKPQMKFFFVPEYEDNQSVIIIKIHHNLTDGQGLSQLMHCFSDVYDSTALPCAKPISMVMWAFVALISPLLSIWYNGMFALFSKETHQLKKQEEIHGQKTTAYYSGFNLKEMKSFCKERKCTLNDYMGTLVSCTLSDYMDQEERRQEIEKEKVYKKPETCRFIIPFSFRQPVKELKDVKLENNLGYLPLEIMLSNDFDKVLNHTQQRFNYMKSSIMPYGMMCVQMTANILPIWFTTPI